MHVRMKKFAMFQQNYMIVLEIADKLGLKVLQVLRVFFFFFFFFFLGGGGTLI